MAKPRKTSKEITSLADLKPDPANARTHNSRNVGAIEAAMNEVGAARSIVIDEAGVVLAGNATIEAAALAFGGDAPVRVVQANGREIIAVQRIGLTDEQKKRLALFDNRSAELAEWDSEELKRLAVADFNFTGLFTDEELAKAVGEFGGLPLDPPDDEKDGGPKSQFGVIVICETEDEQMRVYERLTADGMTCRVVVA